MLRLLITREAMSPDISGPFEFGGQIGVFQQVSMMLSQVRVQGSEGSVDRRCFSYSDMVFLPDPSGAGGEPLRQTAASGCPTGRLFSASLDGVTLPAVTVTSHTWTWTGGVPSQPIPGTLTLAFELTALGPSADPVRMESCYDFSCPCANAVTRVRLASAEIRVDGMSPGPASSAGIGWSIAIWPCLISDPSTCEAAD